MIRPFSASALDPRCMCAEATREGAGARDAACDYGAVMFRWGAPTLPRARYSNDRLKLVVTRPQGGRSQRVAT
jgi:hypothetical protein